MWGGYTFANDFPTLNADDATLDGSQDGFVSKFDSNGTLSYSTYLGGADSEWVYGIAVDGSGQAYVTGYTTGADFPVLNGAQDGTGNAVQAGYVTKFDANGAMAYSTYIKGDANTRAIAVDVDSNGDAWVSGFSSASDMPVTADALQSTNAGGDDMILFRVDSDGGSFVYGSYMGGTSSDYPGFHGLKLDGSGGVFISGYSNSADMTVTGGGYSSGQVGGLDAWLTAVTFQYTPTVDSPTINEDTDSGAITITRNTTDDTDTSHYRITAISGGSLYSDSGYSAAVASGDFVTSAGATTDLYFRPTTDSNTAGGFTVQAATGSATEHLRGDTVDSTITITAVNDQTSATNTTITTAYTEDDSSVDLTDIVVSDVDSGETVTATLTLADTAAGTLTTSGGATYTAGTGVWTITDTVANVNLALAAVSFTPTANQDQDTTLSVNIADGLEDSAVAVTGTITLDVTAVNDQASATNTTTTSTWSEDDSSVALTDIVVSDVDSGETVTATLTLADTAAGTLTTSGAATYASGTGVWTIDDTVANVNSALADVAFTPAADHDQDTTIAINIEDGLENGATALTGTITLDVTTIHNDQTAATNTTVTTTWTEDDSSVALTDIVVSDVDSGETITATLTLADTAAGTLTTSGAATYTSGTGVWTIGDTVANVNSALADVAFTPAVDHDQDTTIAVNIEDGLENSATALTGTITLDVTAVNDQPSATNTTVTTTWNEDDASVALTDIVVSDVDTGETITATLTLADTAAGTLTTSGTATYDSGTGVWTISDTVATVNSALADVAFTPATDHDQDTTIAVNIEDGLENGATAVTGTITLDVTAVNDQASATNTTVTTIWSEDDASVALTDIFVSDADTGETITATLTLADTAAGTLTTSGAATYDNATGVWTISDTVANVNSALADVAFTPTADHDQDTTIAVNIEDGLENGATAVTGTITLDATAVNDQTSATNTTVTTTWATNDASVALTDIVITDVDAGETVTATLTLADTTAGTLTTSGGATYDGATGIWSLGGTVADVNTALADVAFIPAANQDQNTSIAVNIVDGLEDGATAVTGTIALDNSSRNAQPSATNTTVTTPWTEDDASVALTDIVVTDLDADETITATLTLADTAAGGLTTSGNATWNADNGIWTITDRVANVNSALAAVTFTPRADYEVDTRIDVRIADGGEDGTTAVTGVITLDVTAVNDQPTAINTTATTVYSESDTTVALYDMVVSDVDAGETITATLTLADSASGSLSTSGGATYAAGSGIWTVTDTVANVNTALAVVEFLPSTGYGRDGRIVVEIVDGGEDGTTAVGGAITLDVTTANDQPPVTNTFVDSDANVPLADIPLSDPDPDRIVTATLTLTDPTAGGLSANDGASYSSVTGVWTLTGTVTDVNAALDNVSFSPTNGYGQDTVISIDIADAGSSGTVLLAGSLVLDNTAVNDQPSATNTTLTTVWTEDDRRVELTDMVVTDLDDGEIITATLTLDNPAAGVLTTGNGATYDSGTGVWTINGTVGTVNSALADVAFLPTADQDQDTSIAVNIVDGGEDGATAVTGFLTLDVTAVNDAPVVVNPLIDQSTAEDALFGWSFPADVFNDVDSGDSLTFAAALDDGTALPGWLAFDAGARTFSGTPMNDHVGTLQVAVTATDSGSSTVTDVFSLTVTNTNDAPTAADMTLTTREDVDKGGVLGGADVDVGDGLTYEIVTNGDLGRVTLTDAATGAFLYQPASNEYGTDRFTYRVFDGTVYSNVATVVVNITSAPDPNNSGSTEPGPAEPGPVVPDPIDPGPGDPGPGDPGPIDPDPGDPDPIKPGPGDPDPGKPGPGDPAPGDPVPPGKTILPSPELPIEEQREKLKEIGGEGIIDKFQNSDTALGKQVAEVLKDVAKGEPVTQARLIKLMKENDVDPETMKSNLLAFTIVQKEQRTQLFSQALAELEALDQVNIFIKGDTSKGVRAVEAAFPELVKEKVAILIGIDQYDPPISSLNTPVKDVSAVGEIFRSKGYQSIILKNATRDEIVGTFQAATKKLKNNQELVVYFAGHGYLKEDTNIGYWIPSDTSPASAKKWISTKHLSDYLGRIESKHIMVISDSCYSGSLTREYTLTADSVGQPPEEIRRRRSVMMLSSGGEEPVMDGGGDGHSVFARHLMNALDASDDTRTGFELFQQVRRQVVQISPQTPQYGAMLSAGHEKGGDYLFDYRGGR